MLTGLAIVLLPLVALASGHDAYPGDAAIYRSTRVNPQPNIYMVVDNSGERKERVTSGTLYDTTITYRGIYEAKQLYRMNSNSTSWVGSKHPAFLNEVTCSDAKIKLSQSGSWTGLLMKDGSCGMNSEPSEWALGNLLNYEAGINTNTEPEVP